MSAADVSKRCQELGFPLVANVLQKIEGGYRRYITAVELEGLALALHVSPMALQVPRGAATVELQPGQEIPTDEAVGRLSGRSSEDDDDQARLTDLLVHAELRRSCELAFEELDQDWRVNIAGAGKSSTDPHATKLHGEELRRLIHELARVRPRMLGRDETPPRLPTRLALLDRTQGEQLLKQDVLQLELRVRAAAGDYAEAGEDESRLRTEVEDAMQKYRERTIATARASAQAKVAERESQS